MPCERALEALARLAPFAGRHAAATALAQQLGSEDLLVFVHDREVGAFLPALGFPKTLPCGRAWRALVERCRGSDDLQAGEVAYPDAARTRPAWGLRFGEDAVLVFLGHVPDVDDLAGIRPCMPILTALFEAERRAFAGEGHIAVARSSARRAEELAVALGEAQAQLHSVFRELRASQEWFSTTLSSIGDAVIATDARGCITFMNPVAESLTGWAKGEARGEPLAEVFRILAEESRAIVESPVARVIREGKIVGLANHTILVRRDGSEVCIDDSAAPIRGASGELLGVVLVFRDVSERRQAELELEEGRRRTERAVHARENLLAIVSHDLRNPLSAILMHTTLLQSALDARSGEDVLRRSSASIRRSAERMGRLLRDLLEFASIEAGHLAIERGPVRASDLLREVLDSQEALARAKSLTLSLSTEAPSCELDVDRERMLQVFGNLIGNAIKFTPEHGRISLGAEPQGTECVFSVADTGPGIPEALRAKLFEAYQQGRDTRHQGVGLGLYIAKAIVSAHGGRIWVTSTPGAGSTFSFSVPLSGREAVRTANTVRRLLVVDDNRDILESLRLYFAESYRVTVAADGAEALAILGREHVDAIILDLMMPGIDGAAVLREIIARDIRVPVIIASARAEVSSRARELGAADFINKPLDFELLEKKLKQLVRGAG